MPNMLGHVNGHVTKRYQYIPIILSISSCSLSFTGLLMRGETLPLSVYLNSWIFSSFIKRANFYPLKLGSPQNYSKTFPEFVWAAFHHYCLEIIETIPEPKIVSAAIHHYCLGNIPGQFWKLSWPQFITTACYHTGWTASHSFALPANPTDSSTHLWYPWARILFGLCILHLTSQFLLEFLSGDISNEQQRLRLKGN